MNRRFAFSVAASTGLLVVAASCSFLDPLDRPGLGVVLWPRDTALYVGAQYRAFGLMVNEYGDVYPSDAFRFIGLDSNATVDASGTVTGVSHGRARVVVVRGALADTGWVSVVPAGTLAVSTDANPSVVGIVGVDGSGGVALAPTGPYQGGEPSWLPGNAGLVYQYAVPGGAGGIQLFVTDLAGSTRQLLPYGRDPRVSHDGAWVYFPGQAGAVWRIHPDGSGLEQITIPPNGQFYPDGDPDPSPDGTQLVMRRRRSPDDGGYQLVVHTLAGGAERVLLPDGLRPRWSPDGALIAYYKGDPGAHGTIHLVAADGSGDRQVSEPGRGYRFDGLDWSPDGQWLVARADSTLDLIRVSTSLTLPLGYSATFHYASWKR